MKESVSDEAHSLVRGSRQDENIENPNALAGCLICFSTALYRLILSVVTGGDEITKKISCSSVLFRI